MSALPGLPFRPLAPVGGVGRLGRRAGLLAAGAGVVVAGAAVGLAAERYAVGRSWRRADPGQEERFGELRGRPVPVAADDGTALCVEVHDPPRQRRGARAGTPPVTIVFTHGFALHQDTWHYQRRDLGDVGRLVFWDQRGHGRSARGPREHATIEQLGRDMLTVLDATAPSGPVVLVGHSMGGMTVMALAEARPDLFGDRVVGVALLSTSPGRLAEVTFGVPAAVGRVVHRLTPRLARTVERRSDLVELARRRGTDLAFVLTKKYAFGTDVPASLVLFAAQMIDATPVDVLAELWPAFGAHDKQHALSVLRELPVLVMAGERDLVTPAEHSREMAARLPDAELVVLPDAGHLVILEHYDLVNDHLRSLVDRALRR